MGIFGFFKKDKFGDDYIARAEDFESKGDFAAAIGEYEKVIRTVYADKDSKHYRHVTQKIVGCYLKLGDYDRVFDMWKQQYDEMDYGAKEMYELIKILEAGQRIDLVGKVYDAAGKGLARNKVEFLIKQKKIPEAYTLLSELLMNVPESNPAIKELWMTKAKLCLSLRKWEEAMKYLNKLMDKDPHNTEARRLKDFTIKQVRTK